MNHSVSMGILSIKIILATVIITQLNRPFSHVPNLIREATALRSDV